MVLVYFIYMMAFDDGIDCENCYKNYIYYRKETGQVPVFEAYNMTGKLDIIYAGTTEYSDLQLVVSAKSYLLEIHQENQK